MYHLSASLHVLCLCPELSLRTPLRGCTPRYPICGYYVLHLHEVLLLIKHGKSDLINGTIRTDV